MHEKIRKVVCMSVMSFKRSNKKGAKIVIKVPEPIIIAISPLRIEGVTPFKSISNVLETLHQAI